MNHLKQTRERSPDFSRAVLEEMYQYRVRRPAVAWGLWLISGLLGGHRFYLGRTASGLLMLLTGGLGGIWWVVDAFLVNRMVRQHNERQRERERLGMPPVGMEFMPPLPTPRELALPPAWAPRRGGLARLLGDAIVLLIAGGALGAVTASRGDFEALFAVLTLIAITVLGARWDPNLPLLEQLDRWSHRLRLYYRQNDPGGPLSLLFRPIVGLVTAIFRKQARGEVRLYLQLGAVFTIGFTLLDLAQAFSGAEGGLDTGALVRDLFFTFASVYAFATPIGAILTTHLLLERRDSILWTLSGLSVVAIAMGFFS
jgi:hypothetical protein